MLAPAVAVLSGAFAELAVCRIGLVAVYAAGLGRMQYHLHDLLHGQCGPGWRRAAFTWAPLVLANAHNWVHVEHGPHHANVNDFPKDPDDWNRSLRLDIKPLVTQIQGFSTGTGRPLSERLRLFPGWIFLACLVAVDWKVHVPAFITSYLAYLNLTQLFHHSRKLDMRFSTDAVAHRIANSRNTVVRGKGALCTLQRWALGWWMGGHDLQIEHHVFPRMSRFRLREVSGLVRAYTLKVGAPYAELTVPEQLAEIAGIVLPWWPRYLLR